MINHQPTTATYPEHREHPTDAPAGQRLYFEYHCFESNESQDAELWHHTCQICTVVRPLTADEVDIEDIGPMFKIRFDDGYEHDAFADELYNLLMDFAVMEAY